MLKGKVICVTGGASGLGQGICSTFAKFGAIVVIIDMNKDAGLSFEQKLLDDGHDARAYSVNVTDDFETAFFKILLEKIEPQLKKERAVFLYDYPPSQAALAKIEGGQAKRFEFYLDGIELCNAFLEETDPKENKKRIQETNKKRQALGKPIPGLSTLKRFAILP